MSQSDRPFVKIFFLFVPQIMLSNSLMQVRYRLKYSSQNSLILLRFDVVCSCHRLRHVRQLKIELVKTRLFVPFIFRYFEVDDGIHVSRIYDFFCLLGASHTHRSLRSLERSRQRYYSRLLSKTARQKQSSLLNFIF